MSRFGNTPILAMGDFNLNLGNSQFSKFARDLKLSGFNHYPINEITRKPYYGQKGSIIDHIFYNDCFYTLFKLSVKIRNS